MWVFWIVLAFLAPSAVALLFVFIAPGVISAACGALLGGAIALTVAITLG